MCIISIIIYHRNNVNGMFEYNSWLKYAKGVYPMCLVDIMQKFRPVLCMVFTFHSGGQYDSNCIILGIFQYHGKKHGVQCKQKVYTYLYYG